MVAFQSQICYYKGGTEKLLEEQNMPDFFRNYPGGDNSETL